MPKFNRKKFSKNKKIERSFILLFFIVVSVLVYIKVAPQKIDGVLAAPVTKGVAINNELPPEVQTAEKGTEDNPFVILEIVPYEGYAEIGYMIDGCEPIDINNKTLRTDGNAGLGTINSVYGAKCEWVNQERFTDESDIQTYGIRNESKTLLGYYEKVADNTGNFIQKANQTSGNPEFVKTNAGKGNIIWHTVYGMTADKVESNRLLNDIGDKLYTSRTDTQYKYGAAYTYENYNNFLKNVLHVAEKDIPSYQIVVKTIEPDELNQQVEANATNNWINRADLIVISPKSHIGGLPTLWEKYKKSTTITDPYHATDFSTNDLSWKATLEIFKKVIVADDYAGIVLDVTAYDNGGPKSTQSKDRLQSYQYGTDTMGNETCYLNNEARDSNINNIYKLCVMLKEIDPLVFYNLYLNDNGGTVTPLIQEKTVNGKTTGYYTRQPDSCYDSRLYWSSNTFMPTKADGTQSWYSDWTSSGYMWDTYKCNPIMAGNDSIMGRVYTYNGYQSLTQCFNNASIYNDGKFTKELYDYIKTTGQAPSPATAIDYILDYDYSYQKASINVLDLEPCSGFDLTVQDVRNMLLKYSGIINIKRQTSAEFIGRTEDLNSEYDMIYMGLNTSKMNTYCGETKYNDSCLNGKIYLHVGDKIYCKDDYSVTPNWGISGASSRYIRLPGNDITNLKYSKLGDFFEAGYPIVFADKFLNCSGTVNDYYIDPNSNVYRFINTNISRDNVLSEKDTKISNAVFIKSIMAKKPVITITEKPTEYKIGINAEATDLADDKYYINGTNRSNRTLKFRFQINDGTTDSNYTAKIYIDVNADGKYSESELQKSKTFSTISDEYSISVTLNDGYFGAIPWKLQIVNNQNPKIRKEIMGFSAVKKRESEKQTIKVLQINQASTGDPSTLNLQTDRVFAKYTEYLNDFNIDYTTINISQFQKLYNTTCNDSALIGTKVTDNITARYNALDASTDRLACYDMVIIGFADCYGNISNTNGALANLLNYIDMGRSVLMTHDITSRFNKPAYGETEAQAIDNRWGYGFNVSFRDILGMDRFGIRSNIKNMIGMNNYGITADQVFYSDNAYKDASIYNDSLQGYNYYNAMRIKYDNRYDDHYSRYGAYNNLNDTHDNSYTTTKVDKVNDGQIAKYPYEIGDTFDCAETHAQYYQLNMNDPDIVVWYTLAGSSTDGIGMYSASPKDTSNNYYIYNKGNVTYSGMGHSSITRSGSEKIQEVKLFINTMISAYRAGIKAPNIVVNNAVKASDNEYDVYLDVDTAAADYSASDVQEIEFVVNDYNLKCATYTDDKQGVKVSVDGTALDIYPANSKTTKVTDTVQSLNGDHENLTIVKNGDAYIIKYPLSNFANAEAKYITLYAENYKGVSTTTTVKIMRRSLFDLD